MVETDYMPRHTYWTDFQWPSRGKTSGPGSIWVSRHHYAMLSLSQRLWSTLWTLVTSSDPL